MIFFSKSGTPDDRDEDEWSFVPDGNGSICISYLSKGGWDGRESLFSSTDRFSVGEFRRRHARDNEIRSAFEMALSASQYAEQFPLRHLRALHGAKLLTVTFGTEHLAFRFWADGAGYTLTSRSLVWVGPSMVPGRDSRAPGAAEGFVRLLGAELAEIVPNETENTVTLRFASDQSVCACVPLGSHQDSIFDVVRDDGGDRWSIGYRWSLG